MTNENTRLEAVELKLMDLEQTLQELNDVVLQHYRDIAALQNANQQLSRRLATLGDVDSAQPGDEIPPHY